MRNRSAAWGTEVQHEEQKCLASLEMLMGLPEGQEAEVGESLCKGLLKEWKWVCGRSSLAENSTNLLQGLKGIKSLNLNTESTNDLPKALTPTWLLQRVLHWQRWNTCLKIKHVNFQAATVLCQGRGCYHAIATLSSRHSSEELYAVAKTVHNFTVSSWHYHEKSFKLGSSVTH